MYLFSDCILFLVAVLGALHVCQGDGDDVLRPGQHTQYCSQWPRNHPLAKVSLHSNSLNVYPVLYHHRFKSLQEKPSNLFVVSLAWSGLLMMSKVRGWKYCIGDLV